MGQVITIGLDIAKNVFQVHGIDEEGVVVVRRKLRRRQVLAFFGRLPPCLVGLEACATSHYWARELSKLGHEVRMMPPRYVKPYVKRNKTDMADTGRLKTGYGYFPPSAELASDDRITPESGPRARHVRFSLSQRLLSEQVQTSARRALDA